MPQEPLFGQHLTTKAFEALLKQRCELEIDSPFEATVSIKREEYVVRYILRSLITKAQKERFLLEAINDLKGDDTELITKAQKERFFFIRDHK